MTKVSLPDDLKMLGLSENEARVYTGLMGMGKVRAADVIAQTGLHRHLVYQSLEALRERRLVTKTSQRGIAHFHATDPEHLRDHLREQDVVASRVIDELKRRGQWSGQEITVYEGDDAIRTFSLKIAAELSKGECIHVLGSGGRRFDEAMGERGVSAYFNIISKREGGIRTLMYRRQMYGAETLKKLRGMKNIDMRVLPFDVSPSANVVFTDTSVGFQIFEKPYTVLEVRNPHLIQAYKNYFQLLWNQNIRVEQGMEALHDALYDMADALQPGESYSILGGNLGREYTRLSDFFDAYHNYRIRRGVVANILAQRDAAENIRQRNRAQGDPEERISHVKAFETPFLSPMQINLYRGKAVMIIYKEEPTVLYFEDGEVYQGFKLYFDEIWNRRTETLHGHDGVVSLCERVLEEGKDWYLIAATGTILKTHSDYYADFTKRRVAKGIHLHALANEETRGTDFSRLPAAHISYLPPSFASPTVIWIFGDTVAHVLWHEPETVFLIRDAKTAEYYRQYYRALEATAKKE